MKTAKCRKCKIEPDILRAAALTIIKCFGCGQSESALFSKKKAH